MDGLFLSARKKDVLFSVPMKMGTEWSLAFSAEAVKHIRKFSGGKNMKKILAIALAIVMVFGLVACGASAPKANGPKVAVFW